MTLRAIFPRAAAVVALCAWGLAQAATPAARHAQVEADLKAIRAQIARVRERVNQDQIERDRLSRDLRSAETSVGDAREALEGLSAERRARSEHRATLAQERAEEAKALESEQYSLAIQLRSAYMSAGNEPLRILLNQGDPARTARLLAYYSYFGRARARQIDAVNRQLARLGELDEALKGEEQRLQELEAAQRSQVAVLERARASRAQVLARLQSEARDRKQSLARLQRQQAGLEKLVQQLARALEKYPVIGNDAFSRLRGKLAWPVSGKLVAHFGQTRAGGVKWNGVLVSTERGAPVHAISGGRIAYADWLPGLGLLTIIDHGDGYLSLYGHNERLFKSAGEQVVPGDTIASAGDSGGRGRPELYFEIRRRGKPLDPVPWFRASDPH